MDWQAIEAIRQKHAATDNANRSAIKGANKLTVRPRLISQDFVSRAEKIRLARLGDSLNDRIPKIEKFLSKECGNERFRNALLALNREMNRPRE